MSPSLFMGRGLAGGNMWASQGSLLQIILCGSPFKFFVLL
jgi:hypothetical protein